MKENIEPNKQQISSSESEKLDAVRELLFGQNVKEYREEFDELKRLIKNQDNSQADSLSQAETDIFKKIDALEVKFDQKIEEMNQQITEKLDKLTDEKADRKKIASILHQLASSLED